MTTNTLQNTVHGAYTSLDDLMRAQYVAKSIRPQLRKSHAALSGSNISSFRNRGLEFEEVRQYQAGDDIRTIDWRVTARSGETHTKLFREERERPLLLCVDQRLSSFVGSQNCFKSALSAYITALLAWSGIQQKDRVGGIVFNDQHHLEFRPQNSRKNLLRFLQTVVQYNHALNKEITAIPALSDSLAQAFKELQFISHTGSTIFVISDFAGLNQDSLNSLSHIARHNSLCCIQVIDRIEAQFPSMPEAQFIQGNKNLKLNTADTQFQNNYQQEFKQRQAYIQNSFKKYAIPFFSCMTHEKPIEVLQQHLHKTAGRKFK